MADFGDRFLAQQIQRGRGPGIRAVRPLPEPQSELCARPDPINILARKAYLEKLLVLCGVAGKGHGAKAAAIGGISRTTLIGWRNPKALDRGPTDEALALYEEYAQWQILNAKFARTA